MRLRFQLLHLTLIFVPVTAGASEAPVWTAGEMKQLFALAQQSAQAPDVASREQILLHMAAQAYRFNAPADASRDRTAQKVLEKRVPGHPPVKAGQYLTALLGRFYADAAVRSEQLSRFERDPNDRKFFGQMAVEAKAAANHLQKQVQVVVEGFDDAMAPLPTYDGKPVTKLGATAIVNGDKIAVEKLDRCSFVNDVPKETEARTAKGAIKELYSAFKQYNIQTQMFGSYDRKWRKSRGHVRVAVPAAKPSRYLNEIARAAAPAGMTTMHVMTMTKGGELREIAVSLGKASKKKRRRKKRKRAKKAVDVSCPDEIPMVECVRRIVHATTQGTPRYRF